MNDVVDRLVAAAERVVRERGGSPYWELLALARQAARLGANAAAARLAAELEQPSADVADAEQALSTLAEVHGILGRRKDVDRLRARIAVDPAKDPRAIERTELAAAYQALGDDDEADRIVAAIDPAQDRDSAQFVLAHAALDRKRVDRAAALVRRIASRPPRGGETATVDLLVTVGRALADQGDPSLAAEIAPLVERLANEVIEQDRDEHLTKVARLWLAAGKPKDALRIARPVAKRVHRDFNADWYGDLARVLVDAGDEEAGHRLAERHAGWYELEHGAASATRAALAHARWGRTDHAWYMLENKAEERLEPGDDHARRVIVDAYLALNDVAAAILVASEIDAPKDEVESLLRIAAHCRERDVQPSPQLDAALAELDASSSRGGR